MTTKREQQLAEAKRLLRIKKEREAQWDRNGRLAALRKLGGITKEKYFYEILDKYLKGTTTSELSLQYNYTEDKLIQMLEEHYRDIVNAKEAHSLCITDNQGYNPIHEKLKAVETITDDFLSLLSPPNSPTLSEEEALFSWILVHKGDAVEAVEEAGLSLGLFKDRAPTYRRGILTRSLYLQNKNNISQYIKTLRDEKYQTEEITKQYIQQELLEQISQMKLKGDRKDAVNLRQSIELLGKTIGAFTEKIEVHEVDPSRSLDLLISMAKEASIKELTN
jgi:hypothetical protein